MRSKLMKTWRLGLGVLAWFFWGAAALALTPAPSTWPVGDPVAGKTKYNTPYPVAPSLAWSCAESFCHAGGGATLSNLNLIQNGAGSSGATNINNAILRPSTGMSFLDPLLSAQDIADINAYLTNPGLTGLSATGIASPGFVSFSATGDGLTQSATVTFSALGGPLTLSSVTASPSIYSLTETSCTANLSLAEGQSCTVVVTFSSTQNAPRTAGTLVFNYAVGSTPATLSVSLSEADASSTRVQTNVGAGGCSLMSAEGGSRPDPTLLLLCLTALVVLWRRSNRPTRPEC